MNINDLVSGRLYKLKNELGSSDYEKNEDLAMFLKVYKKKLSILTVSGNYKLVDINDLEIPEKNYMEVFDKATIENFSFIMKQFYDEYKKYNNIKYNKKTGFKTGRTALPKLNSLQKELKELKLLPFISIAVDNYFDTYKELGVSYSSLEDLMIDFAYIPEWEENFTKLRGFDFSSKNIPPKKIKKYTNDALMLHHLYTNLFINPNFKNIKAEWLDLLIDKLNKHTSSVNVNNEIVSTINLIKWKCVIENSITKDSIVDKQYKKIDFNL